MVQEVLVKRPVLEFLRGLLMALSQMMMRWLSMCSNWMQLRTTKLRTLEVLLNRLEYLLNMALTRFTSSMRCICSVRPLLMLFSRHWKNRHLMQCLFWLRQKSTRFYLPFYPVARYSIFIELLCQISCLIFKKSQGRRA